MALQLQRFRSQVQHYWKKIPQKILPSQAPHMRLHSILLVSSSLVKQYTAFSPSSSIQRITPFQIRMSISSTTNNNNNNNIDNVVDEFGDDAAFLDDFDVDAAIARHNSVQGAFPLPTTVSPLTSPNSKNTYSSTNSSPKPKQPYISTIATTEQNNNSSKRQKRIKSIPDPLPTLLKYFGYPNFRTGQREAIDEVLSGNDAAIFWATGAGKSICYQIPALVELSSSKKIVLVISPLISLMQDQVHKLNNLQSDDGKILATFIGSAQMDTSLEDRALHGGIPLVYVTPEKLRSILPALEQLAKQGKLGWIAIDEAHCVSEWGHDFRPDFRNIGSLLRGGDTSPQLKSVPLLALTATAVPRVREDIVQSLYMQHPYIGEQSLDRSNLKLSIGRKEVGGVSSTFKPLLDTLKASTRPSSQTTIIYAPSKKLVEEIATFFQMNLPHDSPIKVEYYHAGCSIGTRHDVHLNFVTSQTTVVVATVAFGMGIDKIDTRRIVHYGPPKTVEEYYQQAGRAGRDGLPAECILYKSNADFDMYQSDFYLGALSGSALEATKESMQALKDFCRTTDCRRKALLDYFQQVSSFGERCGTCDNCVSMKENEGDMERDFRLHGALVILQAVNDLSSQSQVSILDAISGKLLQPYRYKRGKDPESVQRNLEQMKLQQPKSYAQPYYKELLISLSQEGYISESHKTITLGNGFKNTYTVYDISPKGISALQGTTTSIILPVPEYIRGQERKEEEKRLRILAKLQSHGVSTKDLPPEEVEQGDGPVVRALSKWYNYVEGMKNNGREERYTQLQNLFQLIDTWRNEAAIKNRVPPASVLAEHTLVGIAYATATLPAGQQLDAGSLVAAGVRSKELDTLVQTLGSWVQEVQPAKKQTSSNNDNANIPTMMLQPLVNLTPWEYAIYKPAKKTGLATWESSYNRFTSGESVQTIAMTPSSGRQPIQVKTVTGHLLDALLHGRSIEDPTSLVQYQPLPNEEEWNKLIDAEAATGMSAVGDPASSGINGEVFRVTDLVRPIVGDDICDKVFADRTEEDKEIMAFWGYNVGRWFVLLRRIGFVPRFSIEGKEHDV